MRRILIPLDGTKLAESIIPDAIRYAGSGGEIILIRDAGSEGSHPNDAFRTFLIAKDESDIYLREKAESLRGQGVGVAAHSVVYFDPAGAIHEAAISLDVDMIACATHGRGPLGRLIHGSIAWRMLTHSPVPVLLRHALPASSNGKVPVAPRERRIMVPLDGSAFAEMALPLAESLAVEWKAPLYLVRAAAMRVVPEMAYAGPGAAAMFVGRNSAYDARIYLNRVAEHVTVDVRTEVAAGSPIGDVLIEVAEDARITDVVMSSHGRTGLSRVILGSVADRLVQHLSCPIAIIPALAVHARRSSTGGRG